MQKNSKIIFVTSSFQARFDGKVLTDGHCPFNPLLDVQMILSTFVHLYPSEPYLNFWNIQTSESALGVGELQPN